MLKFVDITKESNIKCEHCAWWDKSDDHIYDNKVCTHKFPCNKNHGYKAYWNRCKDFEYKWEIVKKNNT